MVFSGHICNLQQLLRRCVQKEHFLIAVSQNKSSLPINISERKPFSEFFRFQIENLVRVSTNSVQFPSLIVDEVMNVSKDSETP